MGLNGMDLRDGIQKVNYEYRGQYSTTLYAKKAEEVVKNHEKNMVNSSEKVREKLKFICGRVCSYLLDAFRNRCFSILNM